MADILYKVPLIPQGSRNTCWLACLRMLVSYQHSRGRQLHGLSATLNDPNLISNMEQLNRVFIPINFAPIAKNFGMRVYNFPRLNIGRHHLEDPYRFLDTLQRFGPFMYSARYGGHNSVGNLYHAIVVTGFSNTNNSIKISYNDPWPVSNGGVNNSRREADFKHDFIDEYFPIICLI